jgi:RimJ/RimL family protein N-acetyltransferase
VDPHVLTDGELLLRPLDATDAAEWLAGEDDEQRRWFEEPRASQIADVEAFILRCQESWRTLGARRQWGIRRVGAEELLGGVELRALGGGEVNVAYIVFPDFRGQGLALKASELALEYAVAEMEATVAMFKVLPGNLPSRKVALHLGAVQSGEMPSYAGATFQVFTLDLSARFPKGN